MNGSHMCNFSLFMHIYFCEKYCCLDLYTKSGSVSDLDPQYKYQNGFLFVCFIRSCDSEPWSQNKF